MTIQPRQTHNHKKYDDRKCWYFRVDYDNKTSWNISSPSTKLEWVSWRHTTQYAAKKIRKIIEIIYDTFGTLSAEHTKKHLLTPLDHLTYMFSSAWCRLTPNNYMKNPCHIINLILGPSLLWIKTLQDSDKQMFLKISRVKWRPFFYRQCVKHSSGVASTFKRFTEQQVQSYLSQALSFNSPQSITPWYKMLKTTLTSTFHAEQNGVFDRTENVYPPVKHRPQCWKLGQFFMPETCDIGFVLYIVVFTMPPLHPHPTPTPTCQITWYCLTQYILKLSWSFEIHWVRQYLVNVILFGIKELWISEMAVKLKSKL